MPARLSFAKYQGLGNDFLVVDLRNRSPSLPSPEAVTDEGVYLVAKALCDRRYGVGGDGVLTISAPTSSEAHATMRVLNADGSEAEMCGNGLRCVAKHLFEADEGGNDALLIDTMAGTLRCLPHWQDGAVENVTVDMGAPRIVAEGTHLTIGGRPLALTEVSMGNPHAIAFVAEIGEPLHALARDLGPTMECHRNFPNRTNAEFAHIESPTRIELWVWERGCGITQACGTGACATAVAACLGGLCETGTDIAVALPGGSLSIRVADDYSSVLMRGPAAHVFDGAVDLSTFA